MKEHTISVDKQAQLLVKSIISFVNAVISYFP